MATVKGPWWARISIVKTEHGCELQTRVHWWAWPFLYARMLWWALIDDDDDEGGGDVDCGWARRRT